MMKKEMNCSDLFGLPLKKYNLLILLVRVAIIVASVVILSLVISQLALNISGWLFSNEDSSTLIDLSINSIFVSVTTIYVLATFGILSKTEESIEQNKISMDINAKNHQRKIIEDKLERFYYPLDDLLKSEFTLEEKKGRVNGEELTIPCLSIRVDFQDTEIKKASGLSDIINHQYLAEKGTKDCLNDLISKMYSSAKSSDIELIEIYRKLSLSVKKDIDVLNEKFASI